MKKACITFLLLLLLYPACLLGRSFQRKKLNRVVTSFEMDHSPVAVIILNSQSGEIHYAYNTEYAFRRRFSPGSLLKPLSAVIFLEHSSAFKFLEWQEIVCRGKYFIPQNIPITKEDTRSFNLQVHNNHQYFKCSIRKGHGKVNLHKGIVHSCNTYFFTWASQNPGYFYSTLNSYWHLNKNTGSRIKGITELPHRSSVSVTKFQAIASSIGEGGNILLSPLKVAQVYSALLEGTPLLRPFRKPYTKTLQQYSLSISKKSRDAVKVSLSQTVSSGTLRGLNLLNKSIDLLAGKTGTGTHYRKKYSTHGWNVIHFSHKNNKYVMVVFVYKGQGGKEAKQLSRIILNAL